MRNSISASTVATISTSTHKSMKRPMSTSIIPSLSLDSRPSISLKRTSTPHQLSTPKRPASTSQSALASSQSQFAVNLLNRASNQNSNRNSIRSSDHASLLIRDFGFKSNDPRHLGLGQNYSNPPHPTHHDSNRCKDDLGTGSSSRTSFWNICASPTGPESTHESELERDQEEAEQSMEIDKLINRSRENSLAAATAVTPSTTTFVSNSSSPATSTATGINLNEIGAHQILNKLSSKYEDLYVSIYDFQADGESEMNLSKGEIVKVLEIICDGWVVARKTKLEIDDDGILFNRHHSPRVPLDDLSTFELPNDDHSDDLFLTGLCPENFLFKISN